MRWAGDRLRPRGDLGRPDDEFRQAFGRVDTVRTGSVEADEAAAAFVAPGGHDRTSDRAGARVCARRVEVFDAEDGNLVDECVAAAVGIDKFAGHDAGLVRIDEADDLNGEKVHRDLLARLTAKTARLKTPFVPRRRPTPRLNLRRHRLFGARKSGGASPKNEFDSELVALLKKTLPSASALG